MLGSRVSGGRTEYCVASEDCAFGPIGFSRMRDVGPGEMLIITGEGHTPCCETLKGEGQTPCCEGLNGCPGPEQEMPSVVHACGTATWATRG